MWCPVERQVRRVQRWLDRCLEACRIGQWQAALAEMECARTDLEIARRSLWEKVTAEGAAEPKRRWGVAVLQGAMVSSLVILAAAHPLGFEDPATLAAREVEPSIVAFVTQDEQALLLALRARLGEGALRQTTEDLAQLPSSERGGTPQEEASSPGGRTALTEKKRSSGSGGDAARRGGDPAPRVTEGAVLPAEDILALVQVGERALRDAAVRVVGD